MSLCRACKGKFLAAVLQLPPVCPQYVAEFCRPEVCMPKHDPRPQCTKHSRSVLNGELISARLESQSPSGSCCELSRRQGLGPGNNLPRGLCHHKLVGRSQGSFQRQGMQEQFGCLPGAQSVWQHGLAKRLATKNSDLSQCLRASHQSDEIALGI